MSAGLPGLGLGGLFFILSALLAPFVELARALRGRSSPGAWRAVGRQFGQAVAMIVAVDVALRLAYLFIEGTGIGDAPRLDAVTVLPLVPIGITAGLLAAVLGTAKAAHVVQQTRRVGLPALPVTLSRPDPLRTLAAGGAAAAAFFGLLAFGASDLSPLSERGGGGGGPQPIVEIPAPDADEEAEAADPQGQAAEPAEATQPAREPDRAVGPQDDGARNPEAPGGEPPDGPGPAGTGPGAVGGLPLGPQPDEPPAPAGGGSPAAPAPPGQGGEGSPAPPPGGDSGDQSGDAGPPDSAGPKDDSKSPDHAGPPPDAGPKEPAQRTETPLPARHLAIQ